MSKETRKTEKIEQELTPDEQELENVAGGAANVPIAYDGVGLGKPGQEDLRHRDRGLLKIIATSAAIGLWFCQAQLNAQTMVGYLQRQTGNAIAVSPQVLNLGNCPPINFNLVKAVQENETLCGFGPFTLPGYSGSVYVGFSGEVPQLSWAHNKSVELRSTSNSAYRWGTDTDFISLYNVSAGTSNYTIHFYFNGPAPSAASLFLVVAGLESGTTATVSGEIGSWPGTGTASLSAQNGGEYTITGDLLWCYPTCVSTSPTNFPNQSGALTFSSGYNSQASPATDPRNTGWDLYQPNASGLGELSLDIQQVSGDGIGFTLGYPVCTTLVGNDLDSRSTYQMYDFSTTTGAATDPRIIGMDWEFAFSPMASEGTLYALVAEYYGPAVGNTLYSVDRVTGAPTTVGQANVSGGALAADPTTAVLYAIDISGNLFTVVPGGATSPIGAVGSISASGMAFDSAGNLYVVDSSRNAVLQVDKSTAAVKKTVTLSGLMRWDPYAQLAIDPATGNAYYAQAGYLYSLNLNTGLLTEPLRVAGIADSTGDLRSLTFTVGACPAGS